MKNTLTYLYIAGGDNQLPAQKYIVVVDDEYDVQELLRYNLKKEGYTVDTFSNPINALENFSVKVPNLILTDWLMPEMNGLEFCRTVKADRKISHIPIIMITCKSDETDIFSAFEVGAEDFLVKPFRIKDLVNRIRKILLPLGEDSSNNPRDRKNREKKSLHMDDAVICRKGLTIDPLRLSASLHGKQLALTAKEFRLLELFARNPGKVFTRQEIISMIIGPYHLITERSVDVRIACLRKKMGEYGNLIKTIRSLGYQYNDPD